MLMLNPDHPTSKGFRTDFYFSCRSLRPVFGQARISGYFFSAGLKKIENSCNVYVILLSNYVLTIISTPNQ
jgi:hypothetical protein